MNTKSKYIFLFVLFASILAACGAPVPASTAVPVVTSTPEPASTAVPVVTSTPEPASVDPAAIAKDFWDAINAKNIDAAMAFVANDIQCRGGCYFTGRDIFNSLMLSTMNSGKVEISDLKVISQDTVTYTWKIYNASGGLDAIGLDLKFQLDQDGKIALIQFP